MPSSDGPEEEFGEETRKMLLNELERRIGLTVPAATRACLWLADIKQLQFWIETAAKDGFRGQTRIQLIKHDENLRLLSKLGMQKDRKDSAVATPARASSEPSSPQVSSAASSLKRKLDQLDTRGPSGSEKVKALCRERDHRRCIISKDFEHDVAHIYPLALRRQHMDAGDPVTNVWTALQYFWSKERIEAWHKVIFPEGKFVEVCYNMMCLSPNAHRYHTKGYFALKPISLSDDKKSLTVKFFWLLKGSYDSFVNIRDTPSLEGRDQGPGYARLINHETTELIRSGDVITLTTEDPENRPLPSFELLEMQWILNRVVALSGAADIQDEEEHDDDSGIFQQEQEDDFDMLDTYDSEEDPHQSPHTNSRLLSSPASTFVPSSPLTKTEKATVLPEKISSSIELTGESH